MGSESESRLGPWILEEQIGSGGLSDVWRSVHHSDGRTVALKILREPDRSAAHSARFLREGLLLERLNHQSLPRCLEASDEPRPHLVLELLEGKTLSQHLREHGPLDITHASTVLEALLKVLHYLHQHGIVHRDVKPSNVYLARDRRVLLLDLGLAVDPEDPLTTTLGDVMGTYAYMAPEQIAGAEVDHRCDLYSLGITLYEALSGKRPFRADDAAGYLEAHRRGTKTPLTKLIPEAPVRFLDTISQLMARDPLARPESGSIARAMLIGSTGTRRSLRDPKLLGRMAATGAVEAVLDGSGSVVLVGDVGAGAGRMAAETLKEARERRFETIALRCHIQAPPLDPIDQLTRDLTRVLGPFPEGRDELCRAMEGLAGEGPLLLLIENVEHCSEAAELALAQVIDAAPGMAVVMTGTRAPLHIACHEVELRPLKIHEVQKLLIQMLGSSAPPPRLAAQLRRMSSGQPAVIVLALKDLVARGALQCTGVGVDGVVEWKLDRNAPLEPTMGMTRLFGSLMKNLTPGALQILRVMAVVGEALPIPIALKLAGAEPSGIDLGPLRLSNMISEDTSAGEDWLSLRRPAISIPLIAQMEEEERRQVHLDLSLLLQDLPSSRWRDECLAWHQAPGAESSQTPLALLQLGEQLYKAGRPEKSLEVLNRTGSLNIAEPRMAARLALARGEVLDRLSRYEDALTALQAGRRLSDNLDDPELQGRALVVLSRVHHHLGDARRATVLAEEAIQLLEVLEESPFLPAALHVGANCHLLSGSPESADTYFRRCLSIAQRQGHREYMARAAGGMGILFAEEGHLEQALHHLKQEAGWFRVHGRKEVLVVCLCSISRCHTRMGRPDLALKALDEAETASRFAGLVYHRALVLVGRAAVHQALGDVGGASQLLEEARDARGQGAPIWIRVKWLEVQACVRLRAGDIQAALAVYQAAELEAQRAGYIVMAAFYLGMTGVITADPDSIMDAMEVLGSAGDRTLGATLLLHGATVGGDPDVLQSAEEEVRASGDRFLLLEVLLACASAGHQEESLAIASQIADHVPKHLLPGFLEQPMIRWTGLRAMLRSRRG